MSKTSSKMPRSTILVLLLLSAAAQGEDWKIEYGGHTKLRVTGQAYPSESVFRDVAGSNSIDTGAVLRLKFGAATGRWSFDTDYQLLALHGEGVELGSNPQPGAEFFFTVLPDDDRRLFDLTHVIDEGGKDALLHRLDRFSIGYTGAKTVVRFGRQALSWGNGLFYAPMDLVNPFDPSTIDTEYKAGDDLLYVQHLLDNGDDVQGAWVVRRDLESGDVETDEATIALKYHGFLGEHEIDVLVAEHYGDTVLGLGGGRSLGGAVWRGDIVATHTDEDTSVQIVTNLSYSWIWGGRNMSGAIEYFYNGFGLSSGNYDLPSVSSDPDLFARLARGELFSIGRHYLAGSVMIEVTPLWTVTPTMLMNVADPSALLQFVTSYSLSDNMSMLASLNLPVGPKGSEFGGIDTGVPDRYLSGGAGLFAQFAWYF